MASKITNTEEVQDSELVLKFNRMVQEHGECQRKAKERIQATKLMSQEFEKWVANSVTNNESGKKETLKELSSKYADPLLKDGPLSYDSGQPEGGHVMAEYEALASSVLQLMRQAEDEATGQRTEEYGKYGAEGCLPELYESLKTTAFNYLFVESRSPTSERIREIALDFSDLLEVIEREKQSLDKLNVHFQICLGLIDKLKEAKTIGKLQSDKLAAAASSLERSCDAFLNAITT